jgi:hypothetical protein
MKKLLLSAFLGFAAIALTPALSRAGTFGLFTGCGCCCSKCEFCVRPYNAFTPVCCGNITCMGCMPFYSTQNYGGLNGYDTGCPDTTYGANDSCAAPRTPSTATGQGQALPPLQAPPASSPTTVPAPIPQAPTTTPGSPSYLVNPNATIQAEYRPLYVPTYNPYLYYNYYAPMGQTPYYWNAK